jgi:tetratricopeptide (TPR) repeat protein
MDTSYRRLASALTITSESLGLGPLILAVHAFLTSDDIQANWLLIFDDCMLEERFYSIFPRGLPRRTGRGLGHIIITSRSPNWRLAPVVSLQGFSHDEARLFVLSVLPQCPLDHVTLLAEAMCYHPLALAQACAYLSKTKQRANLYVAAYHNCHRLRSLTGLSKTLDGCAHTVESTVALALADLHADTRPAAACALWLLDRLAFLAALPVPPQFITMLCDQFYDGVATVPRAALDMCLDYGLLLRQDLDGASLYSMLQLTSDVCRLRVAPEDHNNIRFELIQTSIELFDWDIVSTLPLLQTRTLMLPHVEYVCTSWRARRSVPDFNTISIDEQTQWGEVVFLYRELSAFVTIPDRKVNYCLDEVSLSVAVYGPRDTNTANALDSLATAYSEKCEHEKAIECFEKSLNIFLETLGPNHINTATSYHNMGSALDNKGDFDKAIDCFEKSLAIKHTILGDSHIETANSYDNIGAVYHNKGELRKAIDFFEKSLAIKLSVAGPDHMETGVSYNRLGGVYDSCGEYDKAISYYEKDLAISLASQGPNHPDTAASYNNLGSAYDSKGEYDKALDYYQRDLAVCRQTLGTDHPQTAISFGNAGITLFHKGDYAQALIYCQQAVDINVARIGVQHPDTAISLVKLAKTMIPSQPTRSLELVQQALPVLMRAFGTEHARVARAYWVQGMAQASLAQHASSIDALATAAAMFAKCLGPRHDEVGEVMCDLGIIHISNGDGALGRDVLAAGSALLAERLGYDHPKTIKALSSLKATQSST